MPTEPSFYVNVPSRIDPSAAPDGKDAVVVLVPVGHLIEGKKIGVDGQTESQDWDKLVERAKKQIIGCIEERLGIEGFREMITWEHVNTPLTCKSFWFFLFSSSLSTSFKGCSLSFVDSLHDVNQG